MNNTEIRLAPKDMCTGCGACLAACPKDAINFQADYEGFPFPVILKEKCISCGACMKSCPAIHPLPTNKVKESYAVQHKDAKILKQSTSGGVFSAIANEIISSGGVVYGCVWDEKYNAVFKRAESMEEITPMHGSKYVWSWAGEEFRTIKQDLQEGRKVLFAGLPCQVSGLKTYLKKEYENLYTLDFLCSGAPSPKAFKSYLNTICPNNQLSYLNLKFRDKEPYGVGVHISYNGRKGKKKGQHISNSYYYSFYTRMIDRLSCYNCLYGSDNRISDLTMGDYWGVWRYHKDMDVKAGISALLVNTEKGKDLFNQIAKNVETRKTNIEDIAKENNLSVGKVKSFHKPAEREDFLQTISKYGWKKAKNKYLINTTRMKKWVKTMIPGKYIAKVKQLIKRK